MKVIKDMWHIVSLPFGRVGVGLLCAIALCLASCKTAKLPPLDDVYYWPEKTTNQPNTPSAPSTPSAPGQSNTPGSPKNSKIEYLNVQDTTVTIRIKR